MKRHCILLCHVLVLEYALRADADAVQQAISEAAQDVLDSVGPRSAARTPATRDPGLTQSTLCQQALQHDQVVCTHPCLLLGLHTTRHVGVPVYVLAYGTGSAGRKQLHPMLLPCPSCVH